MNLRQIASIIDSTTAELKADNDRAAKRAALLATDPWPDFKVVIDQKIAAIRAIDEQFQVLRRQQAERDAGDNS